MEHPSATVAEEAGALGGGESLIKVIGVRRCSHRTRRRSRNPVHRGFADARFAKTPGDDFGPPSYTSSRPFEPMGVRARRLSPPPAHGLRSQTLTEREGKAPSLAPEPERTRTLESGATQRLAQIERNTSIAHLVTTRTLIAGERRTRRRSICSARCGRQEAPCA